MENKKQTYYISMVILEMILFFSFMMFLMRVDSIIYMELLETPPMIFKIFTTIIILALIGITYFGGKMLIYEEDEK